MSKYALYTKSNTENRDQINVIDMPSISQAEAYFAGVKHLSLTQLRDLFIVKEINQSNKNLLYANR
tara:strand:+ start:54 stop:251 length:198 start_codon:yes stop_codon:yes gene_type:complete